MEEQEAWHYRNADSKPQLWISSQDTLKHDRWDKNAPNYLNILIGMAFIWKGFYHLRVFYCQEELWRIWCKEVYSLTRREKLFKVQCRETMNIPHYDGLILIVFIFLIH